MTKLEQKLIDLGYVQGLQRITHYYKATWEYDGGIAIVLDCEFKKILDYYVESYVRNLDDLKENIETFNQLQSDLKELKEYEI